MGAARPSSPSCLHRARSGASILTAGTLLRDQYEAHGLFKMGKKKVRKGEDEAVAADNADAVDPVHAHEDNSESFQDTLPVEEEGRLEDSNEHVNTAGNSEEPEQLDHHEAEAAPPEEPHDNGDGDFVDDENGQAPAAAGLFAPETVSQLTGGLLETFLPSIDELARHLREIRYVEACACLDG
jgi:hypothetical protein